MIYPTKKELNKKWWHRLIKVFFWIFLCIVFISIVVSVHPEKNKKKAIIFSDDIKYSNVDNIIGEFEYICPFYGEYNKRMEYNKNIWYIAEMLIEDKCSLVENREKYTLIEKPVFDGFLTAHSYLTKEKDEHQKIYQDDKNIVHYKIYYEHEVKYWQYILYIIFMPLIIATVLFLIYRLLLLILYYIIHGNKNMKK